MISVIMLTYNRETPCCNQNPVPVLLIMTSNAPDTAYRTLMLNYQRTFGAFVGPTETAAGISLRNTPQRMLASESSAERAAASAPGATRGWTPHEGTISPSWMTTTGQNRIIWNFS